MRAYSAEPLGPHLPKFTEHDENRKNEPLALADIASGRPSSVVLELLAELARQRPSAQVRVLDIGCGRGLHVGWLCEHGFEAYGADVVSEYIERGRPFFESRGWGADRLRLIDAAGLPFHEEDFDLVISDQVIEHVEDLDHFTAGVASVTRHAGLGLHIFPATLRPVEPHLRQPLVHWLPKGAARRRAIRLAARAGVGVTHFHELGPDAQAAIYAQFSETETFYRSRRKVVAAFQRQGLSVDLNWGPAFKLREKLGSRVPAAAVRPLAGLYGVFSQTYVLTRKAWHAHYESRVDPT